MPEQDLFSRPPDRSAGPDRQGAPASASAPEPKLEEFTGEVIRVRFENPTNGFAIVIARPSGGRGEISLVGNLSGVYPGQRVHAKGRYEKHEYTSKAPGHGGVVQERQFRVTEYTAVLPKSKAGLGRYLASSIPGIGPKTAELLIGRFGEELPKILDEAPKRLAEVPGISLKRAQEIARIWRASAARRESMIYLQGLGISPALCNRLFKRYGENAASAVETNPYRLAEEVDGIGFAKADAIARAQGFAIDAPERLTAAALYAQNLLIGAGNVCSEPEALTKQIAELTGTDPSVAVRGLEGAIRRSLLIRQDEKIYTPRLLGAETNLPRLVSALAHAKNFAGARMACVTAKPGLTLAPEQSEAVWSTAKGPLAIITGGPGVGKTTVVGEIVRRAKAAHLEIALAAPTGRAAKRLSEATGLAAKTIHRLLNYDPATNEFVHDEGNHLKCELLIVDECSMLDLILANHLFRAIRPGTSVVLIGDADQLPSVGPGTVFADLIGSGFFAVTRLTRIFRQSAGSRIIANAHRVNRGQLPERPENAAGLQDFYWIEQDDPKRAAATIEKLVCERIPQRFGFDPVSEIQVLCPMNRGICGTNALNETLRQRLNAGEKAGFQLGERIFREGDRVMQTANDYEKAVFNGDLGVIDVIFNAKKKMIVRFDDDRKVEFPLDDAGSLVHAYAITIHKSQGSEFPAVVVPILTQHFVMLQRNLLYTAMTRAGKLLILIGSRKAVEIAVRNTRVEPRLSLLARRFAALRGARANQE